MNFAKYSIAIVIPAYQVEKNIELVIKGLPAYIRYIIIVDDASTDSSANLVTTVAKKDKRISLIVHKKNIGVGGATISGFRKALELGAQIIIKLDGDDQMDPAHLPALIAPLIEGNADYVKGDRFRDFQSLQQMPFIRRVGNLGLSFLTKAATGYWNIFDPTNGYFAIRAEILSRLPFDKLDSRYFFETSMLSQLYLLNAFNLDILLPSRYRGETSNMSIQRVLVEFPIKLFLTLLRRIVLKYFIFDFSMVSLNLLTGIPLFLFGLTFGITKWIQYAQLGIPAPTGTVILPTLSVIFTFQILLSAIEIDLNTTPRKVLSSPLFYSK